VVCGLDRYLSYYKICLAHAYLENKDCLFVATNQDSTYPGHQKILPGAGSCLASIETAIGRTPKIVGKPEMWMLESLIREFHLDPNRTCMVGDRLETDIAFGNHGKLKTLLVLTGVTDLALVNSTKDPVMIPTYYAESVSEVYTLHTNGNK